ncbi:MAG TPA: AMP-binding protein [Azospirillaceae bacterium]|nr:AMP-binding protein [Azospirillaceae bacterium]
MNLAHLLHRAGRSDPDRPALALGSRVVADYRTLSTRTATLAGRLFEEYALAPGDRVGILMCNTPAYVEAVFACWHAGLCAVPINAKLHAAEVAYILRHSGARICLVTPDLREALSAAPETLEAVVEVERPDWRRLFHGDPVPMAPVEPMDPAWLFYTSGTTGRPKGAMLTHRNLLTMLAGYFIDVDGIAPGDCILHAAPMSHGSGIYMIPHVAARACNVVPESGGFDPDEVFALWQSHRGVTMFCAPTMVRRLVDAPGAGDPAGLKTIVYGGGPMYVADLKRAMGAFGPRFAQIYGQGEAPMTITALGRAWHADRSHPRYEERLGSVGMPFAVGEVRVADTDGAPLPPGETGEVLVRGDVVMAGYWDDAEATERTLRGGWLHTGDVGCLDSDGFLTLKDRSKDVIITGGSNVYPREVEEVLLAHPDVVEASVVGRPDAEWGESVVAFVVLKPGTHTGPADLDRLCLSHIARFKRPREYRFLDALPKNNYGKVLKRELRELLAGEAAAGKGA